MDTMSQTCVDGSTVEIFRSNGYVLFSAGNNSVIGKKHRLKPGFVSNQSSWPSLRAGSVSFCIKLLTYNGYMGGVFCSWSPETE